MKQRTFEEYWLEVEPISANKHWVGTIIDAFKEVAKRAWDYRDRMGKDELGLSCDTCGRKCKNESICCGDHNFRWIPITIPQIAKAAKTDTKTAKMIKSSMGNLKKRKTIKQILNEQDLCGGCFGKGYRYCGIGEVEECKDCKGTGRAKKRKTPVCFYGKEAYDQCTPLRGLDCCGYGGNNCKW